MSPRGRLYAQAPLTTEFGENVNVGRHDIAAPQLVTESTREHERNEASRHAATIKAMKDDRALGLGRYYGLDCYGGSPGWWRFHTRRAIARAESRT